MNANDTHAFITHLPVMGSLLGLFVLVYGLIAKSYHTQMVAYLIFILAAAGAVLAYFSGNDLGYTIDIFKGVSQYAITKHADFAVYSLIVLFILGTLSLLALWLNLKESPTIKMVVPLVLLTALISFVFVARTGYLGSQIRHFESNNSALPESPNGANKKAAVISFSGN